MAFEIVDKDGLADKLSRLSRLRMEAVVIKNMTQIYNRGKAGGTPVDTGELRLSLSQHNGTNDSTVGYTKSYAPHVEYGHRTVNGGYVQGQRYLQKNVEAQRAIFQQDLIRQLEEA